MSMITDRIAKKVIEVKNENSQQSGVWDISSILLNIFAYTGRKDLIKFSTVCRKWYNIANPIIHKSIKLTRRRYTIDAFRVRTRKEAALIDAEVAKCISRNAKHAHLVKKFKYYYELEPRRAIEVFETFRFICNLTIKHCNMSQKQFLRIISPLTQLQELTLIKFRIKKIIEERTYNEAVQLPLSLKILRLANIILVGNQELFFQTINSHRNLVEFSLLTESNYCFLEPFYNYYPSLLNFEIKNEQRTPQSLFTIFENNPQLISLKLNFKYWNIELVSYINSYLINLEELKLSKIDFQVDHMDFVKFSQPTKIKKLNIDWSSLSNCSLNSILNNCSHLEELDLNRSNSLLPNPIKLLNLSNPAKIKKLAIDCDYLSEGVFDSLLFNCPHVIELNIVLPCEWKEAIKSIYENCENLQRLELRQPRISQQEFDSLFQEFYKTEFFTSNPKCKSTLKQINLKGFKVVDSKSEYFNNFENLKSIKFPLHIYRHIFTPTKIISIDMNLWPGYKLISKRNGFDYDFELKKILN